jgi:hypothetical protein
MIVRRENLATLVRLTQVNSARYMALSRRELNPFQIRQQIIDDIAKLKKDLPPDQLYSYLFATIEQFPKEPPTTLLPPPSLNSPHSRAYTTYVTKQ